MPYHYIRRNRSGDSLRRRAREFESHRRAPGRSGATQVPYGYYDDELPLQGHLPLSSRYGYGGRGGYGANRPYGLYQDDRYDHYHPGAHGNPLPYLGGPPPRALLGMAEREIQPEAPEIETRIPPAGTAVPNPIVFYDEEGDGIHMLHLTLSNPTPGAADRAAAALATAQARRANTQDPADQIVMHAMQSANLTQVSDGPRGPIYLIKQGRQEILTALMELGIWQGGRWELLGVGCGRDEGYLFVIHLPTDGVDAEA
ncbi:hypothetical protein AOQ84DRAFT_371510 [Glonium stellatum]|uniref:Uncharacterized protein n=1 Tax=Glonium stellatum TaxID=574774 RepID=A0A8E2FCM6_9PEZI|nr:hypothetical protein AOQ84DRAFT_371510 [Glonium stellatum]